MYKILFSLTVRKKYTAKNAQECSRLMRTDLNNVVLLHFVMLIDNNIATYIVDNIVHGVQHNIVEACFYQPGTG